MLESRLEEVTEIGTITASLGLQAGDILKLSSDLQLKIHHLQISRDFSAVSALPVL